MVAQGDDQRLVIGVFEGLAEDCVAVAVLVLDRILESRAERRVAIGRMVRLAEPPKHVLHAVGRVKQTEKEPRVKPFELEPHHLWLPRRHPRPRHTWSR